MREKWMPIRKKRTPIDQYAAKLRRLLKDRTPLSFLNKLGELYIKRFYSNVILMLVFYDDK